MRFLTLVLFLFAGVIFTSAAPSSVPHYVHEKREVDPRAFGWVKSRRLPMDTVLPMRFGLTQQNTHNLEKLLMTVAHPNSPSYSQHWSADRVIETFAPSDETIETVKKWLGFPDDRMRLTRGKGWVEVNATTKEVEALLKTEYYVWEHEESGAQQIGWLSVLLALITSNSPSIFRM